MSETTRRPRRAPAEKQRDPERTKRKILDAAKVEFGAKGFAAARVSDIADRAGVNKQLISYYFGGKEGLYQELAVQWHHTGSQMSTTDQPLTDVIRQFTLNTADDRDWGRVMVWANMSGENPGSVQEAEFMRSQVEQMRERQQRGEIPADLDPAYLLLALINAASASLTVPLLVRHITGEDAASPEFIQKYADELAKLVGHLIRANRD
ncbi:TetR family transcriptional regulator [Kibdelosporangium aridum]|uniref:TetR family transcriptional regulator n=1 Tax=Kibdelosporangium aridum TaxID=2030 RepID=A0A428Z7F6_KIBAR|nr:TetR/AcrR family transcriptional regulator [Kibdelosporangium aridum]RSM83530.1 TetR family transcriptional regulator [Kibdelosporangium aridum]